MEKQEQTIQERLVQVQNKLKAPKSKYNSFGKYNYRSCEDILEAVKPLLKEAHLLMTLEDEVVIIGASLFVKATASVTDGRNVIRTTALAGHPTDKKGMDFSQVTGTASSYARKYALNGLFLIDDTKDADTDEYHKQTAEAPEPVTPHHTEEGAILFHIENAGSIDDLNKTIEDYHLNKKTMGIEYPALFQAFANRAKQLKK